MGLSFYTVLPPLIWLMFMLAYGACVGSLVNVLVFRLPRGMGVVKPASRCPTCGHKLSFRENIPVFGWLILRGKCRFCKEPISREYPIVEATVAAIFGLIFLAFFGLPELGRGGFYDALQPDWALNGLLRSWPELVVVLLLFGSLTAVTLIDARTAQIPLVLVWTPALVGLVLHVGHAIVLQLKHGNPDVPLPGLGWRFEDGYRWFASPGELWAIPTAVIHDWWFVGMAIGGIVGLGLSVLLLETGLIRQSFADYDEWEKKALAEAKAELGQTSADPAAAESAPASESVSEEASAEEGEGSGPSGTAGDAEIWIQYPYARREMFKEIAFVALPLALGVVGAWFAPWLVAQIWGPWRQPDPYVMQVVPPVDVPLWLSVLSGVLAGYLIGGGVVWSIRILGSLAFGKEALGLGDVHLVAAIGACVGWIDAVLGFFGAAFVGLLWTLVAAVFSGKLGRTMPYGPYIAVATLLVVVGKPGVEWILSRLTGMAINLP